MVIFKQRSLNEKLLNLKKEPKLVPKLRSPIGVIQPYFRLVYNFSKNNLKSNIESEIATVLSEMYKGEWQNFERIIEADIIINLDFFDENDYEKNQLINLHVSKKYDFSENLYVKGFTLKIQPRTDEVSILDFFLNGYDFIDSFLKIISKNKNLSIFNYSVFLAFVANDEINRGFYDLFREKLLSNIKLQKVPRNMTVLSVTIENYDTLFTIIHSLGFEG